MTDAFRCDGCDEFFGAEEQFLDLDLDTDAVHGAGITLDDINPAFDVAWNGAHGDFCVECGQEVLEALVDLFVDDAGEDEPADTPAEATGGVSDMEPDPDEAATDADVEAAVDEHDELPEFEELTDDSDDEADDVQAEPEADTSDRVSEGTDDAGLGTYDVKEYGSLQLPFSGDVYNHFTNAGVERVHVREANGRYELAPGGSDEWPDYAVSRNSLMIGAPGVRVLGLQAGDEVEARADGAVVVLTPVAGAGDLEEETATVDEDSDTDADDDTDDPVEEASPEPETDQSESVDIDHGDDEDLRWWCGYCGEGAWVRRDGVEQHHDRDDHPGEPVPRTVEPVTDELVATEGTVGNFAVDGAQERVAKWVRGAVPDRSAFTTEDVAVECDLNGNEARDAIEQLDLDDYEVDRDGHIWRIRAPVTGGAA